jgi:hypothetical protein
MRRITPFIITVLLMAASPAPAFPPPAGEAEQLLRQVDETITAAKALRVEFEIDGGGVPDFPLRGSVVLAEGNRFRFEMRFKDSREPDWAAVGDGKRMAPLGNGNRLSVPYPKAAAPAWHNAAVRRWLGRGGTAMSVLMMAEHLQATDSRERGAEAGPVASKARVLPDEMVGGVKARVVEYELTWKGAAPQEPIKTRVWIDPKTKLPVRRTMDWSGIKFTATHTKFEIDPKLDDSLFELPK